MILDSDRGQVLMKEPLVNPDFVTGVNLAHTAFLRRTGIQVKMLAAVDQVANDIQHKIHGL